MNHVAAVPVPTVRATNPWAACRFLTCSVLPVRLACPCDCPFCFSHSSVSALDGERITWSDADLRAHLRWAAARGATRLVVTGGGEPLLRPDECVRLVRLGAEVFGELALFTNGVPLTPDLAAELRRGGLSYLCWSRHAIDDDENRALMGPAAPDAASVLGACASAALPVRATCVMSTAGVRTTAGALAYVDAFRSLGVRQFTFKHTYVAGPRSLFESSAANEWSRSHRILADPFAGLGDVVGSLPWGPVIRRLGEVQACHYYEPTPAWELGHRLARSSNLLSDGRVFASLEDHTSLLHSLPSAVATPTSSRSSMPPPSGGRSDPTTSRRCGPSSPSATPPPPTPTGAPSPTSTPTT